MTDLSPYSVPDLRSLQNRVAEQIKVRIEQNRAAAREQILAIAQSAGMPLKDLLTGVPGTKKSRKGTIPPICYRHPANKALQWSGRGRKPKWVREWLDEGNHMDQLRVS